MCSSDLFTLSMLEGVAYSARLLLNSLQQSASLRPEIIAHAGGGARSDLWCQIRADVLGIPIQRLKNTDAGVAGAAMLAGVGAGLFSTFSEASKRFVQTGQRFEPRDELKQRHDDGFARYQLLYKQLIPLNAS